MDKIFDPAAIEGKWYRRWEEAGCFAPSGEGEPFAIMIPPPNVTGSLHMGHGFQEAIMDALIRYRRMQGRNTLWQVGTDHAGIATQMVVERQLEAAGSSSKAIGREAFIKKVWEWKEESGGAITQQLRRLGSSMDWSRERFTMDPGLSKAVREVFIRLHKEGLIYRGQRLVNWDPALHTAISDLEVEAVEEKGSLWHFRYPLSGGGKGGKNDSGLIVATTRPETMLGDAAVAVHPEDKRYKKYIGKTLRLPIAERDIPVIADDYVDPEFGSGCVKITPAHDFNDYAVGQRHQLPLVNIFTIDAALNDAAPEGYRGLDRFEAREQIVAAMKAQGLLVKTEEHALKIPRGDRSGAVIEPYLTNQWYVKATALAQPAIKAVKDGAIEFVPRQWENTYFAWMRDIQDWCISRQLWWGHRIPAWYGEDGAIYVGESEAAVREEHGIAADAPLRQDDDVLDTWFSSALWTFSTLGWPEETEDLKTFHPTSVLVTGFDIIFFWVARMIMLSLHFRKQVPFRQVYVHGLVRDSQGKKMAKSEGNVLDPIDLIDGIELEPLVAKRIAGLRRPQDAPRIEQQTREEFPGGIARHGADALRFTYYSLASTGRDIKFDTGRIQGYRNFCNKLWNAARYVLMNCDGHPCGAKDEPYELGLSERWIISRLQDAEHKVACAIEGFWLGEDGRPIVGARPQRLREAGRDFEGYRLDNASQAIYHFIWNEYCDWYLELSKHTLRDDAAAPALKTGTRRTLIRVLEAALRLAHPLMPFITEEIWQRVAPLAGQPRPLAGRALAESGASIMLQPYPIADEKKVDKSAERDIQWLQGLIAAARAIRGEAQVPPGRAMQALLRGGDAEGRARLEAHAPYFKQLAGLADIRFLEDGETAPPASVAPLLLGEEGERSEGGTGGTNKLELLVPMAGLIDAEAEQARLSREIRKLEKELERLRGKLGNQHFAEKAPAELVARERERLASREHALEKLLRQEREIRRL